MGIWKENIKKYLKTQQEKRMLKLQSEILN